MKFKDEFRRYLRPFLPVFIFVILSTLGIQNSFAEKLLSLGAGTAVNLQNQGFVCKQDPVNKSFHCRGCLSKSVWSKGLCQGNTIYPQRINIYLPAQLVNDNSLSLAYHLHGFNTDPSVDIIEEDFNHFGDFLTQAKTNSVLIAPDSRGKNLDHKNLDTAEKIETFFKAIDELLIGAGLNVNSNTSLVISGHSGAYTPLAKWGELAMQDAVPHFRKVQGIAFLACIYTDLPGLEDWYKLMHTRNALFYIAYNPNDGSSIDRQTKALIQNVCPNGEATNCPNLLMYKNTKQAHIDFMRDYLPDFLGQVL